MDNNIIMKPSAIPKKLLWASLAVILLGQFVVTIDLTVLNIALPDITKDLKPTSEQLLWIVDSYSLVLAGLIVATSSLSDRFGRKRMLLMGFLIFGGVSAGALLVEDPEQLIALRALLGIGGAAIMPVTIAMIRSIFTDAKERAVAIAVWSAVSALGMAFGPLVGGLLLDSFSWHAAFLMNVPLMGVAFVAGILILPEVKLKNPGSFDLLGSVMFLVGMVALLWGIKHVAAELEFDRAGIIALAVGLVLMALFVFRCIKSKNPLVDFSLFRSKPFSAGVVATLFSTFAMAVLLYLLAQWFQLVNGDNPLEAGIKLVPMAIASLIGCMLAPVLAQKMGPRNVVAGGLIVAAFGMIMLAFFRDNLELVPVIASTCLVGLGSGSLALGATLMMQETPAEKASSAGSLQEVSYDMGNVLGVAILGSVASIIYRGGLSTGKLAALGLDGKTIDLCEQSFAVTAEIAKQTGLDKLHDLGAAAFDDSIVTTAIIGGVLTIVVAVIVWALIPKGMSIAESEEPAEGASAGEADGGATVVPPVEPELAPSAQPQVPVAAPAAAAPAILSVGDVPVVAVAAEPAAGALDSVVDAPNPAAICPIEDAPNPAAHASAGASALADIPRDTVVVTLVLDSDAMRDMESVCQEIGMTTTTAFTVFAKKVVRDRRIPFQLSASPCAAPRSSENG